MTSVAVPTGAPLTRREARELERRREAELEAARSAAQAESAQPAQPAVPADERAETDELDAVGADIESIPMGAAPSDDVATAALPLTARSRRELRTSPSRAAAGRSSRPARAETRGLASRAAILTSLGAVTIAAPLTGFAANQGAANATTAAVAAQPSVLELTDAAAANHELVGLTPAGTSLAADPNAKVVAAELASRAQSRSVSACEPVEGASGFREAFTQRAEAVFRPMAAGTYRDTSSFGPRWGSVHYGTDMAAAVGTTIYAVADGEVVHAGEGIEGRSGQLVIVHSVVDGQDVWTWYGHMYGNGVFVKEGDTVKAGQRIAGVGNNGFSTGPHLHFEVHTGAWDNVINPLTWLNNVGAVYPGQC